MRLESARALKDQIKAEILAPLLSDLKVRSPGSPAGALAKPGTFAVGLRPQTSSDFRLAIRIQNAALRGSDEIAAMRSLAPGEVDEQYIGTVSKRTTWYRERCRPLKIGSSIGHYLVTAGTLGCFVKASADDKMRILSNNHVLANENLANDGDAIIQPGRLDHGQVAVDRVATLERYIALDFERSNRVDAAVGLIEPGTNFDAKSVAERTLTGFRPGLPDFEPVFKVGRTTGFTTGTITALELDGLTVSYARGTCVFDNQIEIEGGPGEPFSDGGDSGSLILDSDGAAVALLFAGSVYGGAHGLGLTYANPLGEVLRGLGLDLLT